MTTEADVPVFPGPTRERGCRRPLFPSPGQQEEVPESLPAWAALLRPCGQNSPGNTWASCLDRGSAAGSP